eukprot:1524458-Rhodomonas_salina.1
MPVPQPEAAAIIMMRPGLTLTRSLSLSLSLTRDSEPGAWASPAPRPEPEQRQGAQINLNLSFRSCPSLSHEVGPPHARSTVTRTVMPLTASLRGRAWPPTRFRRLVTVQCVRGTCIESGVVVIR